VNFSRYKYRVTFELKSMLAFLKTKINQDIHFKELIKESSGALALKVAGVIFGYIYTLIITRTLGAEAMGFFALSLTLIMVFSVISKLGFDNALLRFVAEYTIQDKQNIVADIYVKVIKIVIPICILLSIAVYFSADFIAGSIFNKSHLADYFRIASLGILPTAILFINANSLRGLKKIILFAMFESPAKFIFSILVLTPLLYFFHYEGLPVIAYVVSLYIVAILSTWVWKKNINLNVPSNHDFSIKKILQVSLPMLFSSSLMLIMGWTDIIILGIFKSEFDIGVYYVAFKIATITNFTLYAINSIAAVKFAEFYGQGKIDELKKIIHKSTTLIFWTSFPILLVIVLAPSFILGIFGNEFKTGTIALLILVLGQFVNAASGSVDNLLQMTGRQVAMQNLILIATVLNVFLNFMLIPKFGINGAALASAISISCWNISAVVYIRYSLGILTIYIPFKEKIYKWLFGYKVV